MVLGVNIDSKKNIGTRSSVREREWLATASLVNHQALKFKAAPGCEIASIICNYLTSKFFFKLVKFWSSGHHGQQNDKRQHSRNWTNSWFYATMLVCDCTNSCEITCRGISSLKSPFAVVKKRTAGEQEQAVNWEAA